MAMGPGFYLAKVAGRPGEPVLFEIDSFSTNGFTGSLPAGKPTMWGSTKYADVTNMKLLCRRVNTWRTNGLVKNAAAQTKTAAAFLTIDLPLKVKR